MVTASLTKKGLKTSHSDTRLMSWVEVSESTMTLSAIPGKLNERRMTMVVHTYKHGKNVLPVTNTMYMYGWVTEELHHSQSQKGQITILRQNMKYPPVNFPEVNPSRAWPAHYSMPYTNNPIILQMTFYHCIQINRTLYGGLCMN
jgi:hypothetical protein